MTGKVANGSRQAPAVGVWPAVAAVIMAHLVASKAARDGFFLSNFGASALPLMIAGGALFALAAAWASGRAMSRFHPRPAAVAGFALSGAGQLGEWMLLPVEPGLASIVIYLHMAGLGAVLISAFWSILSEEFDPRAAKRAFGIIGAGGTAGGVLGGFGAERVVATFGPAALVLVLAALHFCAAILLFGFLRPGKGRPAAAPEPVGHGALGLLRRSPYLLKLSSLVLVAATGTALLDFVFKSQAAATIGSGPALLRFLALFHAGVALLTVLAQSLATRRSLESFRISTTLGSLPAVLTAGSLIAAAGPGLVATGIARAVEAMTRHSLFRMGYEVCFTPVGAAEKRRLKPAIDVGAERAGDAIGGGLAMLCVWLAASYSREAALILAGAIGIAAFLLTRVLDRAYVRALADSLLARKESSRPGESRAWSAMTESGLMTGIWTAPAVAAAAMPTPSATPPRRGSDPLLFHKAVRSGDASLITTALGGADLGDPAIAAEAIPLLARADVAQEARRGLQAVAGRITGQLTDFLANPGTELAVRSKIPAVLAAAASDRAVDGLVLGLEDSRFEVRRSCALALAKLARATAVAPHARARILAAVDRELSFGRLIQERQQDGDSQDCFDEFLAGRAQVGLEYVFILLSVVYERGPLLVVFRSLHTNDRHLRGTALEYLEGILPEPMKKLLWEILGERPPGPRRESGEVMQKLMDASPTVVLRLEELKAQSPGPGQTGRPA